MFFGRNQKAILQGRGVISALFFILILSSYALAQDFGLDQILKRSAQIMEQAKNATIPTWLSKNATDKAVQKYSEQSKQILNLTKKIIQDKTQKIIEAQDDRESNKGHILIFITFGEEPEENIDKNKQLIKDILTISPNATVVVRGLPQGKKSLNDFFKYLRKLSPDVNGKLPRIYLDPVRFRKYNIQVAPTILYEVGWDRRTRKAVAWARGSINAKWIKKQVEEYNQAGDLGKIGPTITIAEKDLIEELKERMLKIDWKKKKEQALARYWKRRKYIDLPKAKENRTFYVSGKFKVKKDFILPDGRVIARKGDVIDQFKYVQPTFCLIVFDATSEEQLKWAIKQGKEYKNKYRVKYITTKLPDVEHGWESLGKLYNELNAPVFFLTPDLKERFHLKHAPTLVLPLKDKFEVKEVCLSNTSDTKN